MEPKFQTSFIPKRPLAPTMGGVQLTTGAPRKGTSIYMTIAVLAFIVSLAGIGGAYAWKQYQISNQAGYKQQLVEKEKQFDINTINRLKEISVQIDTAKQLLARHTAVSQIFNTIQNMTIENVRFSGLDVTIPKDLAGNVQINLKGQGSNLSAVAFQSDVLAHLEQYGLRNLIKNPIISDPSLNPDSAVSFGLSAEIDPSTLSYEKAVGASSGSTAAPASDSTAPATTTP